jgi:hypothetical protein
MPEFEGSYDNPSFTIKVDPTRMYELYTQAKAEAEGLVVNIEDIVLAIKDLPWVGESQAVADEFNRRWATAMANVFGTPEDPSRGALQRFLVGIAIAAQNYGICEDEVTAGFNDFANALAGAESESSPSSQSFTEPPITLRYDLAGPRDITGTY